MLVDELTRILGKIGMPNSVSEEDGSHAIATLLDCVVAAAEAVDMLPSEVTPHNSREQTGILPDTLNQTPVSVLGREW